MCFRFAGVLIAEKQVNVMNPGGDVSTEGGGHA